MFCKKTVLAAVTVLPLVGGCAGAFAPTTDAASPIAPRVQTLVDAHRRFPRWADFPAAPSGLAAPAEVAAKVQALAAQGAVLDGQVGGIDWTLGDADTLAAQTRAQVGAVPVSPDAVQSQSDIDAFVRRLRDRAKAPPPIDRRPIAPR